MGSMIQKEIKEHSLIWAFVLYLYILYYPMILLVDIKGPVMVELSSMSME